MTEEPVSAEIARWFQTFENGAAGDLDSYGALADKLDEFGYAKLAHAYRWMCHRRVHPLDRWPRRGAFVMQTSRSNLRWSWISDEYSKIIYGLPPELIGRPQRYFRSHQAAVMWLADRLAALAVLYSVHRSEPKGL